MNTSNHTDKVQVLLKTAECPASENRSFIISLTIFNGHIFSRHIRTKTNCRHSVSPGLSSLPGSMRVVQS